MGDAHEPSHEFIDRLERQVGREVTRRRMSASGRPRLVSVLRTAALVVVSMAIGAAVVASAYQVQDNQRRDEVMTAAKQRADLAQQRVAAAADLVRRAEREVRVGLTTPLA